MEGDKIEVEFPEGFMEEPDISFEYHATTQEFFGPCSFPEDVRPVSAILSLHPERDIQFLKPIKITMPHFIETTTEDDCKRLVYFKALMDNYELVDGQRVLKFEEVQDMEVTYNCKQRFATLHARHCCYYCVGEYMRDDTNKALFCIVYAQEKLGQSTVFHFCLLYLLPTCMKVS